jgi:hypothetical protein
MSIQTEIANPQTIPLRRLVQLTREYYKWSACKVDNPHSQHHRWYYTLASECERRRLDLDKIIGRKL